MSIRLGLMVHLLIDVVVVVAAAVVVVVIRTQKFLLAKLYS